MQEFQLMSVLDTTNFSLGRSLPYLHFKQGPKAYMLDAYWTCYDVSTEGKEGRPKHAIVLKGCVIGTVTGGMGEGLKILKGSGRLLSIALTTRYSSGIWLTPA